MNRTDEQIAKVRAAAEELARELAAKGYTAEQAAIIAFTRGYKLGVDDCNADLASR
jgi:hypothetical protein